MKRLHEVEYDGNEVSSIDGKEVGGGGISWVKLKVLNSIEDEVSGTILDDVNVIKGWNHTTYPVCFYEVSSGEWKLTRYYGNLVLYNYDNVDDYLTLYFDVELTEAVPDTYTFDEDVTLYINYDV